MNRFAAVFPFLLFSTCLVSAQSEESSLPSIDYEVARTHELPPHRRTIPTRGMSSGYNQLRLTLTISPDGAVLASAADGEPRDMKHWPQLQAEVSAWKFTPFLVEGQQATVEIKEYLDLVPSERPPKHHVAPPVLRPNSQITITLLRTGCYGSCPSYSVTVNTTSIVFEGHGSVVASGTHRDTVNADDVRILAKRFVDADFYSMNSSYRSGVTDNPTYVVSISIDGQSKEVEDYVGAWLGMPAVITELEDAVDTFARTTRWISGDAGLVSTLRAEKYNFSSYSAQVLLKEAASQGKTTTVEELLGAGVSLDPVPPPVPEHAYEAIPFAHVGWLTSAGKYPEVLRILIRAEASKLDQEDKDLALAGAAQSGNLEAAHALLAYCADPNTDLSKLTVTESGGGMTMEGPGAGSVLFYAAQSGSPAMLREILSYHPHLEARDRQGQTALFAAGAYGNDAAEGARVECVRLLLKAGADVNATDAEGNTPLHKTFLTDVEEELLKSGAHINARNANGETPIFTTVDEEAFPLFLAYGADLTIRNNRGETALDSAKKGGAPRVAALLAAIQQHEKNSSQP